MPTLKQEAITEMLKLPDTANINDMMAVLDKVRREYRPVKTNPRKFLAEYDGSLSQGRRTDEIMAELRGDFL